MTRSAFFVLALAAALALAAGLPLPALQRVRARPVQRPADAGPPLQHIVVIFQENESFDHYFGTYPLAANPPGEPPFHAAPDTPAVDGYTDALLHQNPNFTNTANGADASNPFRLTRDQGRTTDQIHAYTAEQRAFDHGKMDLFPRWTGRPGPPPGAAGPTVTRGLNLGYFDGNSVTALWNYAQRYAMSDRSFGTTFGPSTVGAINLISGQTNGVSRVLNSANPEVITDGGAGSFTDIGDADPIDDLCSSTTALEFAMGGRNVGDLLNAAGLSWGWFQGGFDLQTVNRDGTSECDRSSESDVMGRAIRDYVPHHEPFQYYPATANPLHRRPASVAAIGHSGDAANHQYDLEDFFAAVRAGNFPAVSFLKPAAYQNGHPGNSDPLDEQAFLVRVVNFLQARPEWRHTAVVIAWDDSDGWYDHVRSPLVNGSRGVADELSGNGVCGDATTALPGVDPGNAHALGRCGYGPRMPLLVISPWARRNYVDHTVTDQTSVLRLIEDTFLHGERIGQGSFDALAGSLDGMFDFSAGGPHNAAPLLLDGATGEPRR